MASINLICFAICLVCIVAGTTISILAIWGVVEKSYVVLKSLLTFGVIFLASLLIITVNKLIPVHREKKENGRRGTAQHKEERWREHKGTTYFRGDTRPLSWAVILTYWSSAVMYISIH
ncbi:MAG: hypothetical protein JRI46_00475 [Deltaproteobacteria bacterium]|nr:hypothetical protein [Deltaproteobacteria bacterium]